MEGRMDIGLDSGLAHIHSKLSDSLKELADKGNQLTDWETQLKEGREKLDQEREELEEERKKIVGREEELEKEKKLMETFPVEEDDVVELNVQGEVMMTLRKTLTQIPDTYLAGLFNGRWESKILRDKEGRVFLDFIPTVFRLLLDYLTMLRLAKSPNDISPPAVGEKQTQDFRILLQHLGLEEAIYGSPKCFSQQLKSSSIVLRSDSLCAMSEADGMGFVLGEGVYSNELVEFVLQVETLEEPWIFIGIIEDPSGPVQDNSFNGNPGAFGWAGLGGVWAAGEKLQGHPIIPAALLGPGLLVRLVLDCRENGNPSLFLTINADGSQYEIPDIPEGKRWRLHINMVGIGDKLELMDVIRHETDTVT